MTAQQTTKSKKITIATVKSFINKNQGKLLIMTASHFDGMQDMVTYSDNPKFYPLQKTENKCSNNLGFCGVWFVGRGDDMCSKYETEQLTGFSVYNCCGSWNIAIRKPGAARPENEVKIIDPFQHLNYCPVLLVIDNTRETYFGALEVIRKAEHGCESRDIATFCRGQAMQLLAREPEQRDTLAQAIRKIDDLDHTSRAVYWQGVTDNYIEKVKEDQKYQEEKNSLKT